MPNRRSAAVVETLESRALFSIDVSPGIPFDFPIDARPFITSPTNRAEFAGGQVVSFNGYAEHADGQRFPPQSLVWRVELYDDEIVTHVVPATRGNGGSLMIPRDASISSFALYRIYLSVTGSDGQMIETNQDVKPQVVKVKLASNWGGADPHLDGERLELSSARTLPLVANSVHELRFNPGLQFDDRVYKFKSARKTGGAGSLIRTGSHSSDPTFMLTTNTKDLKIASRYTSRRIPAAASTGSNGVIVRYTYYGDADLSGDVTLDDFTQFLDGFQNGSLPSDANPADADVDHNGMITLDEVTQWLNKYQTPSPLLGTR
jgi:hypothetical protein